MFRRSLIAAASIALLMPLAACSTLDGGGGLGSSDYALVRAIPRSVGDRSMVVTPPREWNRIRARLFDDVRAVEDWTLNGPYLDGISFISGLKSGKAIVRQDRQEYRQVPKFRADMTPPEVAAMLESLYRVRGGAVDFKTLSLAPRSFLGQPGYQFDFEHLDGDEVWRKGRAVGATVNGRLYLTLYDAVRSHYYNAAVADFEAITESARLKR